MTYKIKINGIVQGVGFRPFVYRLAREFSLKGEVYNTTEGVEILINSDDPGSVKDFVDSIKIKRPTPSLIEHISTNKLNSEIRYDDFRITPSKKKEQRFQLISPDIATCDRCVEDIKNKNDDRRLGYAFTNCTNCGPRFTIIKDLPYDRQATTMSDFVQCSYCQSEYDDIDNRRFHAQPNACKICGPRLKILDNKGNIIEDKDPLTFIAKKLINGKIVALKGLGGFQIACDALNGNSVGLLRKRKNRPYKPFAVMFKDLDMASMYVEINKAEKEQLVSSRAPIVLLQKKTGNKISEPVSFFNRYEGCFLPYTPMHHILLGKVDRPLVMTSGNISEEPIASKNDEALKKLSNVCDYFLTHNRGIFSKYDDSVIKVFRDEPMILRRARGYAPYPVKLSRTSPKTILATGAQEKNTFCILKDNYAIVSQHIGDLDDADSYDFYKSTLNKYISLFNIEKIDAVAYDKHPEYLSTRFAINSIKTSQKIPVQHHEAHLASVMAENSLNGEVIGFLWDGTGYGHDGSIWGSEVFVIKHDFDIQRIAHLDNIPLPGGDVSIKKPYRMALTYLYEIFKKDHDDDFKGFVFDRFPHLKKTISAKEIDLLKSQLKTGYNIVDTTSMGRLFDAVSSIIDLTHVNTYEGQAAIDLEMISDKDIDQDYQIDIIEKNDDKQIMVIDSKKLYSRIISDIEEKLAQNIIASKFHNTIAKLVILLSKKISSMTGFNKIVLSGGVFQNSLLLFKLYDRLLDDGFKVYTNRKVPVNDGGISLGQAYIALNRLKKGEK